MPGGRDLVSVFVVETCGVLDGDVGAIQHVAGVVSVAVTGSVGTSVLLFFSLLSLFFSVVMSFRSVEPVPVFFGSLVDFGSLSVDGEVVGFSCVVDPSAQDVIGVAVVWSQFFEGEFPQMRLSNGIDFV